MHKNKDVTIGTEFDATSIVKSILECEYQAIKYFADNVVDETFAEAVRLISEMKGKLIVSGIGKSGHVGGKIASTFSSVGTSSVFIHPSEASHGDLGMIQKDDVILLLSNSGETAELRDICMYCKNKSIPLICIVNNSSSFIAKHSDVCITMGIKKEAFKDLPAPTSSSTLTLAIGDAIAGCVLQLKNFNRSAYAKLHPGGRLGFILQPIANVMREISSTPLIDRNSTMKDAILEITSKGLGVVGIINDKREILGTISDGDLRRHLNTLSLEQAVIEVMNDKPHTVSHDAIIEDVIELMHETKILSMFVEKSGIIIGIVQLYDLI